MLHARAEPICQQPALEYPTKGAETRPWLLWLWSPSGDKLIADKVDYSDVPRVPVVDWLLDSTAKVDWHWGIQLPAETPKPTSELFVLDVSSKEVTALDIRRSPGQTFDVLDWKGDGEDLWLLQMSADYRCLDLLRADPESGSTKVVLTERSNTFIGGYFWWYERIHFLEGGRRFIWQSERDGWNHLYLYDAGAGRLIRQITRGEFPVRRWPRSSFGGLTSVDETEGQVFSLASGDPVRPYDIHLFRTNLDAKRTQRLTKEDDHHDMRFSPSKKYYVDNHSSPQRPPVAELRSSDGTLIRPISSANEAVLSQLNWRPPEDVHVKAADGETDLFGLLFKPFDFDPEKQYPLIDLIYNGASQETPSSYIHPHGFDFHSDHARALAQLGFLVLVLDGRGTSGRGKHFQDFCYGSVGRNEIPDHAAAIRQLSDARPYVDVDRVGIFGRSAGGYMTIRAMLTEPDLFSVGVASAATAFVRTTACMGPFEENREAYEYGSNLPLAGNLEGELLLIHRTGDGNAPFSYAMKMVDALIRNQKRFDLIVLPGETHYYTDSAKSYVRGAVREYFERRLLR